MSLLLKIVPLYFTGVNLGTIGLFWYDKQQAIHHKWRVPEKVLHSTALLGGWIGGFYAMEKFHHKNKKKSFQQVYYTATACNFGLLALVGFKNKSVNQWLIQNKHLLLKK